MKKIMSIVAVLFIAISASAQTATNPGGTTGYKLENVMISSVKLNEGITTVPVSYSGGTVQITKLSKSSRVIIRVDYIDAAGKSTRLEPTNGTANGAPKPSCKCPIPDACFGSANKNVFMCICKPCDISNGEETYSIGLLLPAVQKIRQAAARM